MALIWFEGFDHFSTFGSAELDLKIRATSDGGSCTGGSFGGGSYTRFGYGLAYASSSSLTKNVPSSTTLIAGLAFRPGSYTAYPVFEFRSASGAQIGLYTTNTNPMELEVRRGGSGGTILATTSTLGGIINQYYHVQFKAYIHDTTGSFEVRLHGQGTAAVSDSNVDTKGQTESDITSVTGFLGSSGWVIDDAWICDTTGGFNDDFLGDVRVKTLMPDAAGNYTAWTASTGNAYQCIDEIGPNDDTDYIYTSTAANKSTFSVEAVGLTGSVLGVQLNYRYRKDDAGSRTIRGMARVNSTDYTGNTETVGDTYNQAVKLWEKSPNTSSAWTVNEIDASEFGVELVS